MSGLTMNKPIYDLSKKRHAFVFPEPKSRIIILIYQAEVCRFQRHTLRSTVGNTHAMTSDTYLGDTEYSWN